MKRNTPPGLLREPLEDKFLLYEMEGKMHAIIDPTCLADMANGLENDELGGAIRLLNRIVSTGRPVASGRVRTICQMSEERWTESSSEILMYFIKVGDHITHRILEDAQLPPASTKSRQRVGVTPEMPIVHPTKTHQVPQYASRERPELISMKKTAYKMMAEIFSRSDQTENAARALLASLLKNWPEGDVYEAISAAEKQRYLVDPRSWIIKHLQRESRPIVAARSSRDACPPPQSKAKKRSIVTPELTGVSSITADNIRERNAGLRLNIGTRKQDA
jgi:uncharacterized protein YdaU (DUF1376 family)